MSWPSISNYQEAIQNPSLCFQLPELRASQIKLNSSGIPNVLFGKSACIFQLNTGFKDWAIHCFLKPLSDQQDRYRINDQHISLSPLPGLLEYQYIAQGILVNNQFYPIVKMPWVEGNTLNQAIEQSLNTPQHLLDLAAKWRGLIKNLQFNKIAHGNLEHSNIIVSKESSLYLINYDNMFTPMLRGRKSLELGNENFQNPRRTLDEYDEKLDGFSALVIYLSLRALAYQPNLWQQFYQGENLIFTKKDFLNPYQSSLFYQLKNSSDEGVQQLTNILENICLNPNAVMLDLEIIINSISTSDNLTFPNQGNNSLPETRVATINPLQSNQPFALPSWQGTPSQINPASPLVPNPMAQGQVNPNFQVPSNMVNPVVAGQFQNVQGLGNNLQPTSSQKPKSPLWLKILAGASSALAFLFIFISLLLVYSYEKRISYLESDVSYYSGLLNSEREKAAKLEQDLAQEKELTEKVMSNKSLKNPSALTAEILGNAFFGSGEIKKLNAKVESVKFYEGGTEGTPRDSRVYLPTFTTASRFVYWELNLSHPTRSYRDNFEVQQVWYKDNAEWARGTLSTYLEPVWGTSYHNDGRGWPQAYKWSPGNYRLELFVDGEKIATGSFSVVP